MTTHSMNEPVEPKQPPENPSMFRMILHPVEEFKKLKETPNVLIPILLMTLLFGIGGAVLAFTTDFLDLLGPVNSPEEIAMMKMIEPGIRSSIFIGATLAPLLGGVLGAVLMWILVKLTSSDATFKQLFSLNVFLMVIPVLGLWVNLLLTTVFGLHPLQYVTGLTLFFDVYDPLYTLAGIVEVFAIWNLILTAIGLIVVASIKPATAWTVTILFTIGSVLISFFSL